MRPERAPGADLSVRIVDPLLMRATYDSVRHNDGFGSVILHEPEDAGGNGRICPGVAFLGEPTFQCGWLGALRLNNPNRNLARAFVVRTVEGDCRGGVATKAAMGFLFQG